MTKRSLRNLIVSALAVAGLGLATIAPAAVAAQPEFATYIVTVAKGSEQSVQARAKALGGEIGYVYDVALNGFSVTMPTAAAFGLARSAGVRSVSLDGEVSIDATQSSATWGLDRIDQVSRPLNGTYMHTSDGSNVTAYIIDTGINAAIADFGQRVVGGINFVGSTTGNSKWTDCQGHGTHVAGTVGSATYGVAKNVKLFAVRVLDCRGSGTWSAVIAGINYVAQNASAGTIVANMSLGGGYSSDIDNAVANAVQAGVVMAVAAGNDTADACTKSPASTPTAITVGATDKSDTVAYFSNFGTCVDIFAPGVGITSWDGKFAKAATWNGTSMATPHVTGVIARYLQKNPSAKPADIASWLYTQSLDGRVGNPQGSRNELLYVAPEL